MSDNTIAGDLVQQKPSYNAIKRVYLVQSP